MPYQNGRDSAPTCGSMMDMETGEILSEHICSYVAGYTIAMLLHSEIRFREAKEIDEPKTSFPPTLPPTAKTQHFLKRSYRKCHLCSAG